MEAARSPSRGIGAFLRPAEGLAAGADVLAGYVLASPAIPREDEALAVVPFLFASAWLLSAAGSVFGVAFSFARGEDERGRGGDLAAGFAEAIARGRATLKGTFLLGALLAVAGLFAAMGAGVSCGSVPVYVAAVMFLVSWARAGRAEGHALAGPASAGALRALAVALGMSAHREVLYFADNGPGIAVAALFTYGMLHAVVRRSEGEGGRRFLLVGTLLGLVGVLGVSAALFMRTALAWIVALTGAAFLGARGLAASGTLVPVDVRRFADAAVLGGFFLASGLCFGRWEATGAVLALGSAAVALAVPAAVALARAPGVLPAPRARAPEGAGRRALL
ncbi:MAG: UbiA prenyltransferase family protein [Planctomycetota bacterium]|jgi:hypothetical protein